MKGNPSLITGHPRHLQEDPYATDPCAAFIGMLENLGTGYLDPCLGGGFGNIASYLLLIVMLVARPSGMFGRPRIERV